ncbi:MAG: LysR family transcriptional regulator [Sphaerochaetaceae bacterium]|nr:LysR family transcriptional regulator [Sphaerochaetaceae bacterium]
MEQDFKYIWQIYKDRSISVAAEHLFITQPALSIALKRVEDNAGGPLFDRGSRPLILTDIGKVYIDMISRMRHLEEDLKNNVEDLKNLGSGNIRIGGTTFMNSFILAPVLSSFARKYPNITINLEEESAAILYERLKYRDIDLTFNCDPDVVKEFIHYYAFTDHILLAVHEDIAIPEDVISYAMNLQEVQERRYMDKDAPAVELKYFKDVEFIMLKEGNNLHERAMEMFKEEGIVPRIKMSISQMVTSFYLAENALGATFVSDRQIIDRDSKLRFFKLKSDLATRTFYAILPDRAYTSQAVIKFVEFTNKYLSFFQ